VAGNGAGGSSGGGGSGVKPPVGNGGGGGGGSGGGGSGPSSNAIIAQPSRQFPLFDQRDPTDLRLYISQAWAEAPDEERGTAHWHWTCLSVVYAMVQHARGNTDYRVGPETYRDLQGGARAIPGASTSESSPSLARMRTAFENGNLVILKGESSRGGPRHFMLATGINDAGNIVALDPYGGRKIEINSTSWTTNGSLAGSYTVTAMRTVTFLN
jgi:hypothetical protein